MDSNELTTGSMYHSVAYGLVEFVGVVPDGKTITDRLHKFKTSCGKIKYIRRGELNTFLKEA